MREFYPPFRADSLSHMSSLSSGISRQHKDHCGRLYLAIAKHAGVGVTILDVSVRSLEKRAIGTE